MFDCISVIARLIFAVWYPSDILWQPISSVIGMFFFTTIEIDAMILAVFDKVFF